MTKFLCLFFRCKWLHMFNVKNPCGTMGLYMCQRCHEWSVGAPWVQGQHTPHSLTYTGVPRGATPDKKEQNNGK